MEQFDNVNNPRHYADGGIECIDAMEAAFGTDAVQDFCLCNAFKYLWRCRKKGRELEDVDKAMWYMDKYKKLAEKKKS